MSSTWDLEKRDSRRKATHHAIGRSTRKEHISCQLEIWHPPEPAVYLAATNAAGSALAAGSNEPGLKARLLRLRFESLSDFRVKRPWTAVTERR